MHQNMLFLYRCFCKGPKPLLRCGFTVGNFQEALYPSSISCTRRYSRIGGCGHRKPAPKHKASLELSSCLSQMLCVRVHTG